MRGDSILDCRLLLSNCPIWSPGYAKSTTRDRASRGACSPRIPSRVTSSQQPRPNDMLPLRVGLRLASTSIGGAAARRVGHQLARRSYVTTVPVRRSNLLLYAGLAGAGVGLHAYNLNNIYCDSKGITHSSCMRARVDISPQSRLRNKHRHRS